MIDSETLPRQLGPYQLIRLLGQGVTGKVFLAHQGTMGRKLAIKMINPDIANDAEFISRFQREGRAVASLRHPHIVQVIEACMTDSACYLVMEFVAGSSLQALLGSTRRPDWRQAVDMAVHIFDALDYAHRHHVIHGNIKPSNVLLDSDGDVVLTDFAISQSKDSSPEYLAPEQLDNAEIDARTDVYSASLLLYEMLTLAHPFRARSMAEVVRAQLFTLPTSPDVLNTSLPRGLAELVMKGLAKKPEDRPATAAEIGDRLRPFLLEEAPLASAPDIASLSPLTNLIAPPPEELDLESEEPPVKEELAVLILHLGSAGNPGTSGAMRAAAIHKDLRDRMSVLLKRAPTRSVEWLPEGAVVLFEDPYQAMLCVQDIRNELDADKKLVRMAVATGEIFVDPDYADRIPTLGKFACSTVDLAQRIALEGPAGHLRICAATRASAPPNMRFLNLGKSSGVEIYILSEDSLTAAPPVFTAPPPSLFSEKPEPRVPLAPPALSRNPFEDLVPAAAQPREETESLEPPPLPSLEPPAEPPPPEPVPAPPDPKPAALPQRKPTLARAAPTPLPDRQATLEILEPPPSNTGKILVTLLLVLGLGAGAAYKFWPGGKAGKPGGGEGAKNGTLVVECKPEKLEVSIDKGARKACQKGSSFELTPGNHTAEFSAKGFQKQMKKFSVKAGDTAKIEVKLQKGKGK